MAYRRSFAQLEEKVRSILAEIGDIVTKPKSLRVFVLKDTGKVVVRGIPD